MPTRWAGRPAFVTPVWRRPPSPVRSCLLDFPAALNAFCGRMPSSISLHLSLSRTQVRGDTHAVEAGLGHALHFARASPSDATYTFTASAHHARPAAWLLLEVPQPRRVRQQTLSGEWAALEVRGCLLLLRWRPGSGARDARSA